MVEFWAGDCHSMDLENDLIFVSVAAYRDPQLIPTIEDCLRKANHAQRLRFGICWQHSGNEIAPPVEDRIRVLAIPWQESKGACWARAQVMGLWQGEQWFLQVDSHCRFAAGWDDRLLRMTQETQSAKPILSTYATPFTPGPNERLAGAPLQMAFQGFTRRGHSPYATAGHTQLALAATPATRAVSLCRLPLCSRPVCQ